MWRNSRDQLRQLPRLSAVVLLIHFVVGIVLSASPALHNHLHKDSDSEGHTCFVTVLTTGGCDAPAEPLAVVAWAPCVSESDNAPERAWVDSNFQVGTVFEHAPPRFLG
jgi:hypothetical protein